MLPLRLVLDTNVVISAALKPEGLQRTVFLLAISKPARLYVSEAILVEYRMVLARPELRIRRGLQMQFLDLLENRPRMVSPARLVRASSDPEDDKFLECADEARADYLVTGNLRHFPKFWKATKVVSAREFVSLAAPHLIG
jgi:putative PIN family toxin of toxin-antitoxin system